MASVVETAPYADQRATGVYHQVDVPRNVVAFTADMAAFMVGTYFIPATTVLVGLAAQLTDDKTLIGAVGMAWPVSWFLPQLIAAQIVRGRRWQKPYLVVPSLLGRNAFLLIALWLLITQAQAPVLTIWVLIGGIALFNLCDALAGVAWFDMLSRALSPRVRARAVSVGQFVGAVLGVGAGIIVERVLSPQGLPFPQNYALIFGCTWVCMMLSLGLIALVRETPMDETESAHAQRQGFVRSLFEALRTDRLFVRVLVVRLLTGVELMAASFYLVFARDQLGLGNSATGIFNMALIIGGIVGIALFGWVADRFTALGVLRTAAFMQLLAPCIALAFVFVSADGIWQLVGLIAFVIVFALRGAIEHSLVIGVVGYLLDAAAERHRAMYVGALNTLGGIVALSPLLGGVWLDGLSATGQGELGYAVMFGGVALIAGTGAWLSLKLPRVSRQP
ncbi:MAG: MFS transporter [Anaerolineae bacterium]|nr:MFS transporter [Anaerolineae bacterium]